MKRLIAIMLALALALAMAGCARDQADNSGEGGNVSGGNENSSNGANGNSDNSDKNESSLDWSAGADASGGEVTLRVATWRISDKPYYEEIIRRFREKYNWIDVKLEINGESSSYYSNLQADIINGTAPDVFDVHPKDRLATWAKEGLLAPQTDFDYMDSYDDAAKQVTTLYGENYAFTMAYNYFGFLYNKDTFREANVEVPTTPEELKAVVEALKGIGQGGIIFAAKTWGASGGIGRAVPLICLGTQGFADMQNGIDNGSILDISQVPGMSEALDTLQFYTDNDLYYNAWQGITTETGMSLFAQEKSAIVYGGTYFLGENETYFPGLDVGFFPIPTFSNNGMTYAEGAQSSCINASGKNLGAAKLWVEFLATPEISSYFCSHAKMLSTVAGDTPDFPEAEMLLSSCDGYAFMDLTEPENSEYWSTGYDTVITGVMTNGGDWEDSVKLFSKKLEEYDLANV